MKLSILFAFVLVLAVSNPLPYPSNSLKKPSSRPEKTWFWHIKKIFAKLVQKIKYWNDKCHELECPKYEVEKTTDDYELRCYPAYAWVGTTYEGKEKPSKNMFMRLFDYIQGENTEGVKINMTVPVATKVETTSSAKRYTMLFFVPYKYQSSPPQPTNAQVSIVNLPKTCVYVKSFSWYMTESKVEKELKELEDALSKDGITDYTDPEKAYIYGGYDSPWTMPWLRVNEVWLIQE